MSRQKTEVEIVRATETTPAMSMVGETEKARLNLSPAEFRAQLKHLKTDVKYLVSMAVKIGENRGPLKLADGSDFGRKQLNTLVSRHNKTLSQLTKNYTARGKRKKRVVQPRAGEGFAKGSVLQEPLVNFLMNANFGNDARGRPLRETFAPLLQNRILSRAILTPLITIYLDQNGLRYKGEDGKIYIRAGPEMERYLGAYLTAIEAADRAKSDAELVDKNDRMKPRFDRNRFLYNRLQSIVNQGIIPNDQLPAEYLAAIESDAVKEQLKEIQQVVSAANAANKPEAPAKAPSTRGRKGARSASRSRSSSRGRK
jgi:hypothetical protein